MELPKEVWLCTFLPGGVLFGEPAKNCAAFLESGCREQRADEDNPGFKACDARRCYLVEADFYDRAGTEHVVLCKLVGPDLTADERVELEERARELLGGADLGE